MKTLILGIGRQGGRILELLIEYGFENIHIYDIKYGILEDCEQRFKNHDVACVSRNLFALKEAELVRYFRQFDFIIDALPSTFSYPLIKAAVKSGAAIVSISFLEEDLRQLNQDAIDSNSLLIPDCGAAPGFSHLLAGYSVKKFGKADSVMMKLGAIPLNPHPPFFHNITWSVEDLLLEYIRKAKYVENGKIITVDPFDRIEFDRIFDIQLESFISNGVRSFLTSFPEVPNVMEKTLRQKGHLDFMKALNALSLLTYDPVQYDTLDVIPIKFLAKLIEQKFSMLPTEDYLIMEIAIESGDKKDTHYYFLEYDHEKGVTAIVNGVAATVVEVIRLIHNGTIKKKGVYTLEMLAEADVYQAVISAHKKLGARYELIEE